MDAGSRDGNRQLKGNAISHSLRLLALRDRSEKELTDRLLRKGFSPFETVAAIEQLKKLGYLDDRKLAERLRHQAVGQRALGKHGMRAFLLKRGIPAPVVDEVVGNDDDYLEAAGLLIERRLQAMRGLDEQAVRRRLWGALARRGFSSETIIRALRSRKLWEG